MTVQERAAGIVIVRFERESLLVLLLRRKSGNWDFCQGRVEPGESELEAALRELKEETGIRSVVLDREFRHTIYYISHKETAPKAKAVCYFLGTTSTSEVTLSESEHLDFCWVDARTALSLLKKKLKLGLLLTAVAWLGTRNENRHVVTRTRAALYGDQSPPIDPSILTQAREALQFMEGQLGPGDCLPVEAFWGPLFINREL